jgi:hypothetical protein
MISKRQVRLIFKKFIKNSQKAEKSLADLIPGKV